MKRIIEWDAKICKTCWIEKPISAFNRKRSGRLHDCHCRDCVRKKRRDRDKEKYNNNPVFRQKRIESARRYRETHPDATRKTNIKTRYWLTIDDIEKIKELQNYKCPICWAHDKDLKRWLMVDHSHFNWDVRWMLCDTCNKFIGRYERYMGPCNDYLQSEPYKKWSAKVYKTQKIDLKNLFPYK